MKLGVRVPVIDFRTVESVRLRLWNLLEMRPELQVAGRRRKPESVIVLGTGDKQDAVPDAPPRIRLRPVVVGPHDDVHTGLFRRREHLRACSQRMRSILGVHMDHGAVVAVDPVQRDVDPVTHPAHALFVHGLEMGKLQTLDRRPVMFRRKKNRNQQSCR